MCNLQLNSEINSCLKDICVSSDLEPILGTYYISLNLSPKLLAIVCLPFASIWRPNYHETFFFVISFFKSFYWSIVSLQCCISFYCTENLISYMYTYIPSFLDFFPILVTKKHWIEFPELYSRFSLVFCFIHSTNSGYMSMPLSQFIPPTPCFHQGSFKVRDHIELYVNPWQRQ